MATYVGVGQNHKKRCVYGIFGREITKYTVLANPSDMCYLVLNKFTSRSVKEEILHNTYL